MLKKKMNSNRVLSIVVLLHLIAISIGCAASSLQLAGDSNPFQYVIDDNIIALQNYIANGYNVNIVNSNGETLLHVACQQMGGRSAIVRLLLANGAEIEKKDSVGMTAIMHAAGHQDTETLLLLLIANAKIEEKNTFGESPLHWAAYGNYENAKILIQNHANVNIPSDVGATPLFYAARSFDQRNIYLLVHNGADTSIRTTLGLNSLFYAVSCQEKDNASALLKFGVNLTDTEYSTGYSVLFIASFQQDTEMMRLLIDHGANINEHDNNERTILHHLARIAEPSILEWYIRMKPDDVEDDYGMRAIDYALERTTTKEHVVDILRRNGY